MVGLEAVAQCCVLASDKGEEGITFEPSCIRVTKVTGISPEGIGGLKTEENKKGDEMSTVEQRDKEGKEDRRNGGKDEGGESGRSCRANDEGNEEARASGEEPAGDVEREREGAPSRTERQHEQATLGKCTRAGGQTEVGDDVSNGKREGEKEWEDWVDTELETDELRSQEWRGGGGE
ncbi:hypothetical protein P4O66_000931 [Electrophorus voltai]|uniref:Uncharacterized protein n=1 Tax=Electrophorus voltai TaxID=2609070 RepID=A0AAD8ZCJ0_9TELE|nr:hypothetical protein P4O66_000931 [Electrophorus voltai]